MYAVDIPEHSHLKDPNPSWISWFVRMAKYSQGQAQKNGKVFPWSKKSVDKRLAFSQVYAESISHSCFVPNDCSPTEPAPRLKTSLLVQLHIIALPLNSDEYTKRDVSRLLLVHLHPSAWPPQLQLFCMCVLFLYSLLPQLAPSLRLCKVTAKNHFHNLHRVALKTRDFIMFLPLEAHE